MFLRIQCSQNHWVYSTRERPITLEGHVSAQVAHLSLARVVHLSLVQLVRLLEVRLWRVLVALPYLVRVVHLSSDQMARLLEVRP